MATEITTLKSTDETKNLLPRTRLKALSDEQGDYLSDELTADDLNQLAGITVVTSETLSAYRTASAQDTIDEGKVDKETGKGLSTNDYTTAEKNKLSGIETGAQKNAQNTVIDANYVHTDNNYTTAEKTKLAGLSNVENFSVTLLLSRWSGGQQTITNPFFVNSGYNYIVSPTPSSLKEYAECFIYMSEVGASNNVTFYCDSTPTHDLYVNVMRCRL